MGDTIGDVRSVFLSSSGGIKVSSTETRSQYSDIWFYLPTAITKPNESTYDAGAPLRVMVAQFFSQTKPLAVPSSGASGSFVVGSMQSIFITTNLPVQNQYSLGSATSSGMSMQNVLAVLPGLNATGNNPYYQNPSGATKENMLRTGITSLTAIRVTLCDDTGALINWTGTAGWDPKWVLELKFA